jgi:RNA polymerase sigma-70 factor (ECF subfamily)
MHHEPAGASDQDLVARVLNDGDERAFRTLYRRHTPYLYQFALRTLGGDEQEAEDVVQETWIRGVERLSTFRWDAALRSWLVAIALNVCRGLFRRKDAGWLELTDEMMEGRTATSPELKIDLERALAQLPAGYRAVVLLHDVEGYRHEDIARELGTTVGTSKSQLFHGRRALRRLLGTERESEASTS